jgi:hypothetical protein
MDLVQAYLANANLPQQDSLRYIVAYIKHLKKQVSYNTYNGSAADML